MIHAMIDGTVIASIHSWNVLLTTAFAVMVCAFQDAVAFAILLERHGTTRRNKQIAFVLFGGSFPLGTGIASTLFAHVEDFSNEAMAVLRVLIVPLFLNMAFELAPPHTHDRRTNLKTALLFGVGVAVSSSAELVERAIIGR